VANRLDLFRDRAVGFIGWLSWSRLQHFFFRDKATGVEPESGEASVMVQASAWE
jgi:hypothetical protein